MFRRWALHVGGIFFLIPPFVFFGFSTNVFGYQYTRNGVIFDPSIGRGFNFAIRRQQQTPQEAVMRDASGEIVDTSDWLVANDFVGSAPGDDDDDVWLTNQIRSRVSRSPAVQKVEASLIDGNANKLLQLFDAMKIKAAGYILKAIDYTKFFIDNVAPITNESLNNEVRYTPQHKTGLDGRTYIIVNGKIVNSCGTNSGR